MSWLVLPVYIVLVSVSPVVSHNFPSTLLRRNSGPSKPDRRTSAGTHGLPRLAPRYVHADVADAPPLRLGEGLYPRVDGHERRPLLVGEPVECRPAPLPVDDVARVLGGYVAEPAGDGQQRGRVARPGRRGAELVEDGPGLGERRRVDGVLDLELHLGRRAGDEHRGGASGGVCGEGADWGGRRQQCEDELHELVSSSPFFLWPSSCCLAFAPRTPGARRDPFLGDLFPAWNETCKPGRDPRARGYSRMPQGRLVERGPCVYVAEERKPSASGQWMRQSWSLSRALVFRDALCIQPRKTNSISTSPRSNVGDFGYVRLDGACKQTMLRHAWLTASIFYRIDELLVHWKRNAAHTQQYQSTRTVWTGWTRDGNGEKTTQPAPRSIRNRTKKFDDNVTKRGHVPIGKAGEHSDDPPISKGLIAFFLFVVVGSSFVQVLRMFQTSVPDLGEDEN
ncbi:hypothetical protein THAOC_37202 [Thalassiosira oceanica]|uniref:Stress-associated endoplasmic reticulum protein n=1 Tax=Thalassiosira oceanica TaxID=159749 RepID=K0R0J0_THAOC|nr:hypothetical protein THAOC_37202 [Thalassiosira oceanica]|eukprot:EJK44274.1 hypothetical protein THAOC_37202 [Thalassiosira oceanica]